MSLHTLQRLPYTRPQACLHPERALGIDFNVTARRGDKLFFVQCNDCGGRGPSKSSKPLAWERWRAVGTNWKGRQT